MNANPDDSGLHGPVSRAEFVHKTGERLIAVKDLGGKID